MRIPLIQPGVFMAEIENPVTDTAKRFNSGKVRYDLIPTHLLEQTARVFEFGAKKYSEWNWAKPGMKWSTVIGCMKRHLAAIERGENLDPESGLPHLGHLMCNAFMLTHYMENYPEDDDRPTKWFKQKVTQ
jgi:hypothetical protein